MRAIVRVGLLALWLLAVGLAAGVEYKGRHYALSDPMPAHPGLEHVRLKNGLLLFLLKNTEPENRVFYALVEPVGSLVEEENERGLAHFLEHMAFNGTARFPGQAVRDFLERTGMKFGPDLNAYTSFTKTVYLLEVPAEGRELTGKAARVLADWAGRITFDPEEIEKERGVIIEEDRLAQKNLNGRLLRKIVPAYFGDTRYARRLPIGDMALVKRFKREDFLRFYRKWYRPGLQAVVAVGDADLNELKAELEAEMGALAPRTGPGIPDFPLPLDNGPVYQTITDPEMPAVVGLVTYKTPGLKIRTVGDFRAFLVDELMLRMISERLDELVHSADPPFLRASLQPSEQAGVRFLELSFVTEAAGYERGLKAAAGTLLAFAQKGFDETRLKRAKRELLRTLKEAYDKQNDTDSAVLRSDLIRSFLKGTPYTSAEWDYRAGKQLLEQITLDEVNAHARLFADAKNRIVLAIGPQAEAKALPDPGRMAEIFAAAGGEKAAGEAQPEAITALMEPPAPARVVEEGELHDLGFRWFVLENGARVWVKTTDFVADQVRFAAASLGGASLVPDEDYLEAVYADDMVSEAGVGRFDRVALDRFLAGKNVSLQVFIENETEGMEGSTDRADLETLLQLVHLYFVRPREDEAAARRVLERIAAQLENRKSHPDAVFMDKIRELKFGAHPRYTVPDAEAVRAVDVNRAFAIYKERFQNAADFGFVFVGDVDYERVKQLAARYLGTLPASGARERYRDHLPPLPREAKRVVVRKGIAPQALVYFSNYGELPELFDRRTRLALVTLTNVLELELTDVIREEVAGSYAPQALGGFVLLPRPRYDFGFVFTAAPDRVASLAGKAKELIEALAAEGPDRDRLEKAKAQTLRALEEDLKKNDFWRGFAVEYLILKIKKDPQGILRAADQVAALGADELKALARRLVEAGVPIEVYRLPER